MMMRGILDENPEATDVIVLTHRDHMPVFSDSYRLRLDLKEKEAEVAIRAAREAGRDLVSCRQASPAPFPKRRRMGTRTVNLLVAVCVLVACQPVDGPQILRTRDGAILNFHGLADDLEKARVVFVGELHDSREHHETQLRIIRYLSRRGRPVAIGLEMFQTGDQPLLDGWVAGRIEEPAVKDVYYRNWELSWDYYRAIMVFAREAGIPLVALNLDREIINRVARTGFESLELQERDRLGGIVCIVDFAYEGFIRRALGMHSHGGVSFRNFCEAQLLWDEFMARRVDDFLTGNPEASLVVLAGGGHSWKKGIPSRLTEVTEKDYRVILPESGRQVTRGSVTAAEADYLWLMTRKGGI